MRALRLAFVFALAAACLAPASAQVDPALYGATYEAHRQIGLDWLHGRGYTGAGIKIGVFDSGFNGAEAAPHFTHLFARGGVPLAVDVFAGSGSPYDDDVHGHYVLSVLAGRLPGQFIGAAPEATYYLFRTEHAPSETHAEETAWAAAMAQARALGLDVVVSSLGYSTFDPGQGDYTYADMNGQTTLVTQAANTAAPADVVVVSSAGNEGSSPWRYITAPCDAPELICVGAVDAFGTPASFSSVGPTADGRVKPDVSARGLATPVITPSGNVTLLSGTSYAAPLVAGLVACLRQAHPWASAAQVIAAVRESGSLHPANSIALGYGIADGRRADDILRRMRGDAPLAGPALIAYPNPATDRLSARLEAPQSATSDPVTYVLHDLSGRIILRATAQGEEPATFAVAHLEPGLYLLRAEGKSGQATSRVLITR